MSTEVNGDVQLQHLEAMLTDLLDKLEHGYPYRNGGRNRHLRKVILLCDEVNYKHSHLLDKHKDEDTTIIS